MDENIFKCFWEETYQELVTENKNKGDFVDETRFKGKKTKKNKWERNPALTMYSHNSSSLCNYFFKYF